MQSKSFTRINKLKKVFEFWRLPSIGVLKIQICTWFNQFLGQLQISILNSKVKSSSWFSKRFCYEMNTLLNYINLSIPLTRILNVEVWSWINQFLCYSHVTILYCQEQSSSVIMNSFRWKISHCKEYMIDATDRQMEGQTSNLRLLNDQWSLWWLPNES